MANPDFDFDADCKACQYLLACDLEPADLADPDFGCRYYAKQPGAEQLTEIHPLSRRCGSCAMFDGDGECGLASISVSVTDWCGLWIGKSAAA